MFARPCSFAVSFAALAVVLLVVPASAAPKTAARAPHDSAARDDSMVQKDALAERLVALRSEVEALSADLVLQRTQAKEDLRLHAEQRRDLESERSKEELRLARILDATARLRAEQSEQVLATSDLRPQIEQSAAALKVYVEQSLPYRRADRAMAIDALLTDLDEGRVTAAGAAPRLYTLIQDEKRLTEDSERVRETLSIGGERLLVDAVRLGMVTMFFRTDDGRVGRVGRAGDPAKWTVELLPDADDKARVDTLLDAFGKQIRTGWFELPLALPPRAPSPLSAASTGGAQ